MKKYLAAGLFPLLAACAEQPDAIQPVSMAGAYDGVSCKRAQQLLTNERANLATLSKQQSEAVTGDAVGVFLLGVPMSSVAGGDKGGEIAAAKGKILALEARMETCR